MAIKTAAELAAAAKNVVQNYKTLYVMGCFGAPMTESNKTRYPKHHSYNRRYDRKPKINAATADTFGFDCVCLIKGLLWGWNGDASNIYGGAYYVCNGVPDLDADQMIKVCTDVSKDFSTIQVGEAVWMSGHIGVYIGDGLAVECTPIWKDGVQITAVQNIGSKEGYNARKWTKHGKLPYVTYEEPKSDPPKQEASKQQTKSVVATGAAHYFDSSLAGTYTVTEKIGLYMRHGAGYLKKKMVAIPWGYKVQCYGYYSKALGAKWLYVQITYMGVTYTGFMPAECLKK